MIELTGFQRDLLYVLLGLDGPNGVDVRGALVEYYESDVVAARVYQNLDRLADRGLVEKAGREARTNTYAVTECGRNAIESRRAWEDQYLDSVLQPAGD